MDSTNWPANFGNNSNSSTTTSYTSSSSTGGGSSSFEGFPSFSSFSQPSFTSHTESHTSNSSNSTMTFYLASVSNGHVLAHQENGRPSGVVVENKGDRGDEQKWTIEYGDEPNTVALKCAANDKYLHCFEGKSWGKVGTGDKQWWKISNDDVSPPGACRIGPVDFPDVYLNHHSGNTVRRGAAGTKVHMYKWEVSVPKERDRMSQLTPISSKITNVILRGTSPILTRASTHQLRLLRTVVPPRLTLTQS
jgi:hypothetical protein